MIIEISQKMAILQLHVYILNQTYRKGKSYYINIYNTNQVIEDI